MGAERDYIDAEVIGACPGCGREDDVVVIRPMQPAAGHKLAAWCRRCRRWTGQAWDRGKPAAEGGRS